MDLYYEGPFVAGQLINGASPSEKDDMSLHSVFVETFATALSDLTAEYDPCDIAGVGAYTDADASSIVFMAHTRANQRAQIEADPDYASDAVWNVVDWDLSYSGEGPVDGGQARSNRAIDALEIPDIESHREHVWNSVVRAMTTLSEQRFFDHWPNAVTVLLVADGSNESLQCDWNIRWNGPESRAQLREYFGLIE